MKSNEKGTPIVKAKINSNLEILSALLQRAKKNADELAATLKEIDEFEINIEMKAGEDTD